MDYRISYLESAKRDLSQLPSKRASQIITKLKAISTQEDPLSKAKKLKGIQEPTYRFRIGDYRAIFRLNKETNELIIILIIKIAHRKDAY